MKVRFPFIALFLAAVGLHAQAFTVVHCTEGCKHLDNGKAIAAGEKVTLSEKISLGSPVGKMVLWDPDEGFRLLVAQPLENKKWKTQGNMTELNQAMPEVQEYAESFHSMEDLVAHFQGRKYLLLGSSWLIADPAFNASHDTVLFFKFERPKTNGQVSRKLERRGDSLLLAPKFILDMNGVPVPADDANHFQLFWLDLKNKGYLELAKFEFVFVDESYVASEVGRLVQLLREAGFKRPEIEFNVHQFLTAVYGSPDIHNLQRWMHDHFPE